MLVEHEPVSLSNPRQGEPPFTGDGLSQALYCVLVPPTHVLVHWVQLPHEPQFPFTNRKMIGVVDEGWYYDFSSLSTADFNKISNISVDFLCSWCIAHNIKECYTIIIPVYQSR